MRLFAICRLCPQACTKMPPPPCELSVMPKPSMLDGLHWKLLGNGFGPAVVPHVPVVKSVVPTGKPASASGGAPWKSTPFDNTVMPAPSSAPINEGSCSSSARLPLTEASQPTVASNGKRSTCGLLAVALKPTQLDPAQPGSHVAGEPFRSSPNRQLTFARHVSILPAGCGLASMMLEAAPTPCSRTGFHISNISWWADCEWGIATLGGAVHATGPVVVVQVGSTMIRSPGWAESIAAWIEPEAATWVGAFPPTVTVTVSTDC